MDKQGGKVSDLFPYFVSVKLDGHSSGFARLVCGSFYEAAGYDNFFSFSRALQT
jgi:hypothetical protein